LCRQSPEEIIVNRTTFSKFENNGHLPSVIQQLEVIQKVSQGNIDALEDIK